MNALNLTASRFNLYVKEYNRIQGVLKLIAVLDDLDFIDIGDPFNLLDTMQDNQSTLYVEMIKSLVRIYLSSATSWLRTRLILTTRLIHSSRSRS